MYTVVINHQNAQIPEMEIHTDYYREPHKKLQSATLELEENTAGTFTFTVPKGQIGNDGNLDIDIKSDEVLVFQNPDVHPEAPTGRGKEIWRGFFLENNTEFFNSKTFTCIGELAYLNETVQKDATYKFEGDNEYPEKVFKALLKVHNDKAPEKKRFLPGTVTVKADNTAAHLVNKVQTDEFYTTYSDHTFDCIKKLIDSCGGYLKIRRENDTRYLDWLTAYEPNGQTINFGKNLLDYAVEQDVTDLITVLYPFGESVSQEVDDGQGGTTTKRVKVNISTATGQNGRMYVTLNDTDTGSYSQDPMTELGWREGTVDFPNVRDPNNLKRLAINYLKNQWDPDLKLYTKIQIKAVDLAYFTDEDADPIEFLQSVKVTSTPHGITNKVVPVTKMTIPLLQPEQTIYTMSTAMRKTKQISTSVTDHDKDIEKTQETVDEIGGGGGGEDEGEGQETVHGTIDVSTWVMGTPSIGITAEEEAEGTEYIAVSKHLKLFYDASEIGKMGFVETWEYLQDPQTITLVLDGGIGEDTAETVMNMQITKANSCYGLWAPKFMHSSLLTYNDPESRGDAEATYADSCYGFSIRTYYTGPNNTGVKRIRDTNPKKLAEGLMISKADGRFNYHQFAWGYIKGLLQLSNPTPTTDAAYIDLRNHLYTSGMSKAHMVMPKATPKAVIGPYVRALLPLPMRPLTNVSGRGTSLVIYIVCEFVSGSMSWNNNSANGLGLYKVRGQVAPAMVSVDSYEYSGVSGGSTYLCQGPGVTDSGSGAPIDFYPLDMITERLSESNYEYGCHIFPKGHLYAYAFMHAVGPGKKYPLTTDITGGLAVCMDGVVYTGCSKWHKAMLEAGYQTSHVVDIGYVDDPKKQFFTINQAIEFDDEGYQKMSGNVIDRAGQGCINIAAIAVCTAAPYQITMDEVAENLKSMYDKYGW